MRGVVVLEGLEGLEALSSTVEDVSINVWSGSVSALEVGYMGKPRGFKVPGGTVVFRSHLWIVLSLWVSRCREGRMSIVAICQKTYRVSSSYG